MFISVSGMVHVMLDKIEVITLVELYAFLQTLQFHAPP